MAKELSKGQQAVLAVAMSMIEMGKGAEQANAMDFINILNNIPDALFDQMVKKWHKEYGTLESKSK